MIFISLNECLLSVEDINENELGSDNQCKLVSLRNENTSYDVFSILLNQTHKFKYKIYEFKSCEILIFFVFGINIVTLYLQFDSSHYFWVHKDSVYVQKSKNR